MLGRTEKGPFDRDEEVSIDSEIEGSDEYSDPDSNDDPEEESDNLLDVDLKNLTQPAKVPRYAEQIIKHAQQELPIHAVSSEMIISTQDKITAEDRMLAVCWILRMQKFFEMTTDALYTSVGYLNAALARHPIQLEEL
jgi:hypothetical protein